MYPSETPNTGPKPEGGPDAAVQDRRIKRIYQGLTIAGGMTILLLTVALLWKGAFASPEALRAWIGGLGVWGALVFLLIQTVQVMIPILPGGVILLAGALLFGPVWGFVYNYVGIVAGSILAFLTVRRMGRPFLQSISGKKRFQKYSTWLEGGKRFDRPFAAAILLPLAPDGFLCMLAGLTNMSLQKFTRIIVLCKPPTILVYSIGLQAMTGWISAFFG